MTWWLLPKPCALHKVLSHVFSWLFLSFFILTLLLPSLFVAFPTPTTGDFTTETYNRQNKVIVTQDPSLEGCQTKTEVPLQPDSIFGNASPFLSLSYWNTGECLQDISTLGGCRYWSWRMEFTSPSGTNLKNSLSDFHQKPMGWTLTNRIHG